ncbi:MAG TPA: serine/threonine-protein kinase [Polyangiaceae bacterium]|nr:serine/threonine-protein kinase [Polyangiaceae bacterium]
MTQPGLAPVREGDLLAGKYRVERVLGVGGMGVVVAARHEQLDQLVAIKFVREEALGNPEAVERFLREARAAVKLKSEHAAKVLDVGTLESGAPYMVMEYLEGADLAQTLADGGPVPVEAACDWVLQACEAVAEAHAAGIVHRDLKPQNLFLARTVGGAAKVKVLDFGVSKSVRSMSEQGALTRTRAMLGSPLYMAPEQMRSSRDVDARADVWALGVVLFELLTHRWPFEAETMPELCLKVVTDAPLSLADLRPDVPAALVAVVERCLEKPAEKRFANAAELASALEPFVSSASRIIAERARLAMMGRTRVEAGAPKPTGTLIAPSRTGPTPSAWGSGRGGVADVPVKPTRPILWMGAVVLAAAVGGLVAVSLRGTSGSSVPAASPPPSAQPPPPAPPVAEAPPAETVSAALETAPPPGPPTATLAALPPPPAVKTPVTPPTPARPAAGAARPAAPKPANASKPTTKDDDIPVIR